MKIPEHFTWTSFSRVFGIYVIFVTAFITGFAFVLGHSVDIIISRLSSIDIIVSIFLVSVSLLIYTSLRYMVVWLLVATVPSLIWQEVGIPFILIPAFDRFDPFATFSWIPALVTLGMTILFWSLEILEAKYIGVSEEDREVITLSLK